jgi:site-specific DNA-cytosine methylase
VAYTLKIRSGCEGGGKGALIQDDKSATLATNNDQQAVVCLTPWDHQAKRIFSATGKAPTLQSGERSGQNQQSILYKTAVRYIVRRLTPTECARLQGFPDKWGHYDEKDSFTPEEFRFWHEVRNTHAAINGKKVQDYTETQMLTWYNKLHTDSAEYKMWGNGIALPPALYCIQGIVDAMDKAEEDDAWLL